MHGLAKMISNILQQSYKLIVDENFIAVVFASELRYLEIFSKLQIAVFFERIGHNLRFCGCITADTFFPNGIKCGRLAKSNIVG